MLFYFQNIEIFTIKQTYLIYSYQVNFKAWYAFSNFNKKLLVIMKFIKILTTIVLLWALNAGVSAQDLRRNGSSFGKIESDGTVRLGGSSKGKIERDGTIRVGGSSVGKIEHDGTIRKGGSSVGKVERDGTVRIGGSSVGKIEDDGTVRKGGSSIGSAKGVRKEYAAVLFFFEFFK